MDVPATSPTRSYQPPAWPPTSQSIPTSCAMYDYLRNGAQIYMRSFEIIRAETDLCAFSAAEADIVVRMIHACGLVEASKQIVFGAGLVEAARGALRSGAAILCDAEMVAH